MPVREPKTFLFDAEARAAVLAGAQYTYRSVRGTFGPMSGNVGITKLWAIPRITHDGVTVAREVKLPDMHQNIGAELLAQASKKTNETAGDGTSATVIVGYQTMFLSAKSIASGRNPMLMKRGIKKAALDTIAYVDTMKRPLKAKELAKVATISASGDKAIGELIAEVVSKVGAGVTIEEYPGLNIEKEIVDGFYIDKGNESPQLTQFMQTEEESNPVSVLVLEKHILKWDMLYPFLEKLTTDVKRNKLLIVGKVSGVALDWLVQLVRTSPLELAIVDCPIYGQQRAEFLMDVCAVTGAHLTAAAATAFSIHDLGECKSVTLTSRSATIVEGNGDPEQVNSRIAKLTDDLKRERNEVIRWQMEQRLAKLTGRIGIIRVGGAIETEVKERKDRVDDAVHAAQAAVEDGVVAGGGTTLVKIAQLLERQVLDDLTGLELPDEIEGYRVAAQALKQPFVDLMRNSGQRGEYNLAMLEESKYGMGYNAERPSTAPIDLWAAGIIDPAKVIKLEVENGFSIAADLITMDTTIAHLDIEKVETIEDEDL